MGALSINGSPALRSQFEPLLPGCPRADAVPLPVPVLLGGVRCNLQCADEIDGIVQNEGPETVAAVILEPVQNSAGSITPPEGYFERVREICDEHGSCSWPTRSSAASAASATGSGPRATGSSRT